MLILSELLSTIGMILLAGEYIQGDTKWFNRSLERFIINIFPNRLLFLKNNPLTVTGGIVRLKSQYIMGFIITPLLFLFIAISTMDDYTSHDAQITDAAIRQALNSPNQGEQQRALEHLKATADFAIECTPLVNQFLKSLDSTEDPSKSSESVKAAKDCLDKWVPRTRFDVRLSVFEKIRILITLKPLNAIIPLTAMVASLGIIFYFLSLCLFLSRFYSRLKHIESFVLPVGFAFTAIGQSIKLLLVLFFTNSA